MRCRRSNPQHHQQQVGLHLLETCEIATMVVLYLVTERIRQSAICSPDDLFDGRYNLMGFSALPD